MKLGSLLYQLAVDLNDAESGHEYTTWTQDQLRAYLSEGIQATFTERPDLFMEVKTIKVTACDTVQDTCECSTISKVLGQATASGRVIRSIRRRSSSEKLIWRGKTCPGDPRNFELREYSIDPITGTLQLYPPVPPDVDVYIAVECSVRPDTDNWDDSFDLNNEVVPMVMQWALYRAKMVDGENNALIIQVAVGHKNAFWELVTANRIVKAKEEQDDRSI